MIEFWTFTLEGERVLRISNANGGYKRVTIIRNCSLQVAQGEIVALLGRNGAGKSTMLKYTMGLVDVFSGSVLIDGNALPQSTSKRVKMGLGYVPQGRYVFPRLSVSENIAVAAVACGHDRHESIENAFEEFPVLAEKKESLAGTLSGGQQQILSIARALATKPRVLLLDEPTEGVQPSIIEEIREKLKRLNEQGVISILIAEQNLDFCLSIASRAYILNNGFISHESTRDELLGNKTILHELLGV